jgi:lysine-specific demethylase 8
MNVSGENNFDQTSINQVERIHKVTPEEFKRKIVSSRQPVIITGKIASWKASSLWSVDYLNTVVGNKEINVNVSKNKIFTYDPQADFTFCSRKMKFTDFTDWILQEKKADEYYYLQQSPMKTSFPELLPDIETPDYIAKALFKETNLWIGTGGNISPLHYDSLENLLCQFHGRKRVLLFEPKQTPLLYPFSAYSTRGHMSQVNIDQLDIDKFPKFEKAKCIECILEPGEMIFIPAFWWHQVYSLDQLNIAVNFWWNPNFKQFFTPHGRRSVVNMIWEIINN